MVDYISALNWNKSRLTKVRIPMLAPLGTSIVTSKLGFHSFNIWEMILDRGKEHHSLGEKLVQE